MGRRIIFLTIIAVLIAVFLRLFVIEGIYVASGSMEPTFYIGTHLFLEKVILKFRKPRHGDIIVFPSPVQKEHDLIKRVIGLPGDEIEIKEKQVYRNGELLDEDYVQYTRAGERLKGDTVDPLIVPEAMVFVLGDNRDESRDSRDWIDKETGEPLRFIAAQDIKGTVISLY